MISCIIDAKKGREVATDNTPGDFLQTDYDKGDINIKLEGDIVTLLEDIDRGYYKDFTYTDKRGRKCMYAEAKKTIYGTLYVSVRLANRDWPAKGSANPLWAGSTFHVECPYILAGTAATPTINRNHHNFETTLLTRLCMPTDYQWLRNL